MPSKCLVGYMVKFHNDVGLLEHLSALHPAAVCIMRLSFLVPYNPEPHRITFVVASAILNNVIKGAHPQPREQGIVGWFYQSSPNPMRPKEMIAVTFHKQVTKLRGRRLRDEHFPPARFFSRELPTCSLDLAKFSGGHLCYLRAARKRRPSHGLRVFSAIPPPRHRVKGVGAKEVPIEFSCVEEAVPKSLFQ